MGTNEHTGARLVSKISSDEYKENYEKIFGKGKECNSNNNCDVCVSSRNNLVDDQTQGSESICKEH